MKIYLDLVFLENFIMDFILIYQVHKLLKVKKYIPRLIIASLIGAGYMVIAIYLKQGIANTIIMKLLVSIVMIYISFLPKTIILFLKQMGLFYLISFIYTGIINVIINLMGIKEKGLIVGIFVYFLSFIISNLCTKYENHIFKLGAISKSLIYKIKFLVGEKEFEYTGMIDTGNSVKDMIFNKNVIFIEHEENLKNVLLQSDAKKTKVLTSSINGKGEIDGFIIKKSYLSNDLKEYLVKDIVIVLVDKKLNKENKFNAIIGINTYLDDLGGMLL